MNPERADLVLVSGNPVEEIKATRLVKRAWLDGTEIVEGNQRKGLWGGFIRNLGSIYPELASTGLVEVAKSITRKLVE